MIYKTLAVLGLSASFMIGSIAPAMADGAAGLRNVLLGGGAAYYLIQSNHNKHQRGINQNLYNSGRMGTFWYNGHKVNCHKENGNKACYQRNDNHWDYIPDK